MGTATVHPAVEDLAEPLLDEPDRRVCEFILCDERAAWVATCRCGGPCLSARLLICDEDVEDVFNGSLPVCRGCWTDVDVTSVEPIR